MKTVLRFTASWCGPCKVLAPIIGELEAKHSDKAQFNTIDVDNQKEMAQQYNISGVPTVIILENGVEKQRIVGMKPKNIYESAILN
jgi:thioredoxin 1